MATGTPERTSAQSGWSPLSLGELERLDDGRGRSTGQGIDRLVKPDTTEDRDECSEHAPDLGDQQYGDADASEVLLEHSRLSGRVGPEWGYFPVSGTPPRQDDIAGRRATSSGET